MTPEELERLAGLLLDVNAATALLPEDEQRAYREAQESVIAARDAAQRFGATHWIF